MGGSTISQAPASSDKQSGSFGHISRRSETKLPPDGENFRGSQGGVMVVDEGSSVPLWGFATDEPTRFDNRVRCILPGLESSIAKSGTEDWEPVVTYQAGDPYQLSGAIGSIFGNSDICQGEEKHEYTGEDRQCSYQGIHESSWENSLTANEFASSADMEVVHRAAYIPNSRASSRSNEPGCRWGIKDSQGPMQLDDSPTHNLADREEFGSFRNRPVCILSHTPGSLLFQLKFKSSRRSHRCFHSGWGSSSGICRSSMVSITGHISKESAVQSQGGPCNTHVKDTTVVSSSSSVAEWVSSVDPNAREFSDLTNPGGVHHAIKHASIGCLAIIRQWG